MFPFEEVGGRILLSSPLEFQNTTTAHKTKDFTIKKNTLVFSA